MPYEITHDIYHVDEPEGFDALQEATTELEQAEARIEELEGRLASAVDVLLEGVQREADNIMLIDRIEELEAKLAEAERSLDISCAIIDKLMEDEGDG